MASNKRLIADYSKLVKGDGGSYVKVSVRLRPCEGGEESGAPYVIPDPNKISLKDSRDPFPTEHVFAFHRLYDRDTKQDEVYAEVAAPMIPHVFTGYNACVFAYGQTGSGKTYSMYGRDARGEDRGIVPRTAAALFSEASARGPYTDATIAVSLCEIYCDRIRDLGKAYSQYRAHQLANEVKAELKKPTTPNATATVSAAAAAAVSSGASVATAPAASSSGGMSGMRTSDIYARAAAERHGFGANDPHGVAARYAAESLEIREDGKGSVYVKDLTILPVHSVDEVLAVVEHGFRLRATHETRMNAVSSRSHTIFTFHITQRDRSTGQTTSAMLNLVDLAGSERLSRSESTGQRLLEAQSINSSLSALGMVVTALQTVDPDDGPAATHIPYRDSKLTRVLQNSLGGNSYTSLLATVHPRTADHEETLSTLHFANRCQAVLNRPKINYLLPGGEDVARRLRQQDAELAVLRHRLIKFRLTGAVRVMRLLAEAGINGCLLPDGRFKTAPEGVTIGLQEEEASAHPYVMRALALLAPEPSEEDAALYEQGQETRAALLQAAQAEAARGRGSAASTIMSGLAPMTDDAIEIALNTAISGMATAGGVIGAGAVGAGSRLLAGGASAGASLLEQAVRASASGQGSRPGTNQAAANAAVVAASTGVSASASAASLPLEAGGSAASGASATSASASASASGWPATAGAAGPFPSAMGSGADFGFDSQASLGSMLSAGHAGVAPGVPGSHAGSHAGSRADSRAGTAASSVRGGGGGGGAASSGAASAHNSRPGTSTGGGAGGAGGLAGPGSRAGTASAPGSRGVGAEGAPRGSSSNSVSSASTFMSAGTALHPGGTTGGGTDGPVPPMPNFFAAASSMVSDGGSALGGGGGGGGEGGGVAVNRALARTAIGKLGQMIPASSEESAAEIAKLKNRINELKREVEATKAKSAADVEWQHRQARVAQEKADKAAADAVEQVRMAKEQATQQAEQFNKQVTALLKASTQMQTDREMTLGRSLALTSGLTSKPGTASSGTRRGTGQLSPDEPLVNFTGEDVEGVKAEYHAALQRVRAAAEEAQRKALAAAAKDLQDAQHTAEATKHKLLTQLADKTKEVAELRAQLQQLQARLTTIEVAQTRAQESAASAAFGVTLSRTAGDRDSRTAESRASTGGTGVGMLPQLHGTNSVPSSRPSTSSGIRPATASSGGGESAAAQQRPSTASSAFQRTSTASGGALGSSAFTAAGPRAASAGSAAVGPSGLPRSTLIQAWEGTLSAPAPTAPSSSVPFPFPVSSAASSPTSAWRPAASAGNAAASAAAAARGTRGEASLGVSPSGSLSGSLASGSWGPGAGAAPSAAVPTGPAAGSSTGSQRERDRLAATGKAYVSSQSRPAPNRLGILA